VPLPVHIIGIGADGLDGLGKRQRKAIDDASLLAGGKRQLSLVGSVITELFEITNNVQALVERLRSRGERERCVVLASGDPLLFGIGRAIIEGLGSEQVVVEPAISSLQLGFARAGVPWHHAALASIHGRELASTLRPLLGRSTIGLLSHDGASPSAVAAFFLAHGLEDYRAWVCERLGAAAERITPLRLAELAGKQFDDLNVIVLRRNRERDAPAAATPGIPDAEFARPGEGPVLLTHADVRAVTLSRFRSLPPGPIWDIGKRLASAAFKIRI